MPDILGTDLARIAGRAPILNADLRQYSRWRAGGRARVLVEPATASAMRECLSFLSDKNLPTLVIGDGSNILFDDAGFDGVILKIGRSMSALTIEGPNVRAEAGIWVPNFVRLLGGRGLWGLEHAIGIPGTIGGLITMNGGSRRHGVGQNLVAVRGCDGNGKAFERSQADCRFVYRGSTLQTDKLIVLEADFRLEPGPIAPLRRDMIAIMMDRRTKFPKNLPNCGSVFLSDPAMYNVVGPPGAAIERVGLKGRQLGQAQISPLHANFIVNLGGARSSDILGLIDLARQTVHDETGFWMDAEVRHVAPNGVVLPAHQAAAGLAASA